MPRFNNYPDTDPLTKEEKSWCRKVENLLKKTPERFGLATMGDPNLHVFDKYEMDRKGILQEEFSSSRNNLDLAELESSEHIQGWCG